MSGTILLGYDDSPSAKSALDFAVGVAKANGCELTIAHVLEWSPYSFLTPQELEERHQRRKEELKRAEEALLDPVRKAAEAQGVSVTTVLKYGHIAETICAIAEDIKASQIVVGRTGHSSMSSRLFGSVAGSLAQAAPVAVTIVP